MSTFLISLYFDDETNLYIKNIIKRIKDVTGNDTMLDIPPHITIGMINADNENAVAIKLKQIADMTTKLELQLVSVGMFGCKVLFLQPVLSEELQRLSEIINDTYSDVIHASSRYRPYGWIPHITLAKHLIDKQQLDAIKLLQNEKVFRKIQIEKIGLAKTKPYEDVAVYEL